MIGSDANARIQQIEQERVVLAKVRKRAKERGASDPPVSLTVECIDQEDAELVREQEALVEMESAADRVVRDGVCV